MKTNSNGLAIGIAIIAAVLISCGQKAETPPEKPLAAAPPGKDKEQNWLPAPKDKFILMMWLYRPKETPPSILDGSWRIPAVKEISG